MSPPGNTITVTEQLFLLIPRYLLPGLPGNMTAAPSREPSDGQPCWQAAGLERLGLAVDHPFDQGAWPKRRSGCGHDHPLRALFSGARPLASASHALPPSARQSRKNAIGKGIDEKATTQAPAHPAGRGDSGWKAWLSPRRFSCQTSPASAWSRQTRGRRTGKGRQTRSHRPRGHRL